MINFLALAGVSGGIEKALIKITRHVSTNQQSAWTIPYILRESTLKTDDAEALYPSLCVSGPQPLTPHWTSVAVGFTQSRSRRLGS